MQGYIIARIDVHDAETYAKYTAQTPIVAAQFGGEFLARGGHVEVMEGETRDRCVIIRFPDMDTAKAFYHSDDYQRALGYALPVSTRDYKFVEGV